MRWNKTARQQSTNEQNETTAGVSNEQDTSDVVDNEGAADETDGGFNVWNEFGSLRDLFDKETKGAIEKVVSELNSPGDDVPDDVQESENVVNTCLEDVNDDASGKNSSESSSDTSSKSQSE